MKTQAQEIYLVRRIDSADKLGPWGRIPAETIEGAAALVFGRAPTLGRVLVRGPEEEVLFVAPSTPGGAPVTREGWRWARGGLVLCERPCVECSEDHHLSDVLTGDFLDEPNHPAAKRGVPAWLKCKHCDAWVDYGYGEGIEEALEASIEDEDA